MYDRKMLNLTVKMKLILDSLVPRRNSVLFSETYLWRPVRPRRRAGRKSPSATCVAYPGGTPFPAAQRDDELQGSFHARKLSPFTNELGQKRGTPKWKSAATEREEKKWESRDRATYATSGKQSGREQQVVQQSF